LGRGSGDTGEHAAPWPGSCWRLVRRFESWAGFVPEGNAHDLLFREVCWSYREDFSFRSPLGALMESGSFNSTADQQRHKWIVVEGDLSDFYLRSIRGARLDLLEGQFVLHPAQP
jgi:hypothetical protein